MQRWQLTLGLGVAAIAAAFVAPRLFPWLSAPDPAQGPQAPLPLPIAKATPPTPPDSTGPGSVAVSVSLDQKAVLKGVPSDRFLVIDLSGPDRAPDGSARAPVDLAVVLDTSGSMAEAGKIDYARNGARYLVSELGETDSFALIGFNDFASTIVPLAPVGDRVRAERAIDRVTIGGGTNLGDGLEVAARTLATAPPGEIRRLVLLSDGQANVGLTDPDRLARRAAQIAATGVSVSTVGLGLDYNEDLLARVADLGGGTYDFVDTPQQLHSVLAAELDRTSSQVARGARVEIELPAGVQPLEVVGWDAQRTARGWSVYVGDVYAHAKRKIIARVRVTPAGEEMPVAAVHATWDDVLLHRAASSDAGASVSVTEVAAIAAASVDTPVAVEANRAYGNWYREESNQAYKAGRREDAKNLLDQAVQVLTVASTSYNAPALAEDADDAAEQAGVITRYDANSDEGKRSVKESQEKARDLSR
jgi:Ca-activated chloride channel family protein